MLLLSDDGRLSVLRMYLVCMCSHLLIRCGCAVMRAICPYSKRGRTYTLNRRIRVCCEGPKFVPWRVWRLMHAVVAFVAIVVMCCLNERSWSKITPRNLPEGLNGIGVLWNSIGLAFSSLELRDFSLNTNSKDFFSLMLILLFPQKSIT